jgi:hypothetical protein
MPQEADDIIDHYEILRDYVKHEDGLVNQRLSWLLALHGFLYGSLALTLQEIFKNQNSVSNLCVNTLEFFDNSCARVELFVYFICSIGLWIAYSVRHSIKGAIIANNSLVEFSKNIYNIHVMKDSQDSIYVLSRTDSSGIDHYFPWLLGGCSQNALRRGFSAPKFIPLIIIVSWSVIMILHSLFSIDLKSYMQGVGMIVLNLILVITPYVYFEILMKKRKKKVDYAVVPKKIVQLSYIDDGSEPLFIRKKDCKS